MKPKPTKKRDKDDSPPTARPPRRKPRPALTRNGG